MSAPHLELKHTEHLALGFMANGAGTAIEAFIKGEKNLPEYEAESLKEAAIFLRDVASGATFVSSGKAAKGFNASRSLEAFDYAMQPIEALRMLLDDRDVVAFFADLARVVAEASRGDLKQEEFEKLEKAAAFFRAFHQWVTVQLSSERPSLGSPTIRKSAFAN